MKNLPKLQYALTAITAMIFVSCAVEPLTDTDTTVENPDYAIIRSLGLSTDDIVETEDSYIVEGDIAFEKESMREYGDKTRQRFIRLVSHTKVNNIKVYINPELQTNEGGGATWYDAALEAIAEWNSIPDCTIHFSTVASAVSADVVVIRNSEADDQNYIAYAYYPSSSGNPGRSVNVGFECDYLSTGQKKRTMTHEFGHILGFMHPYDTTGTHIPGTPNGEYESIMHISQGRAWGSFTAADIIAAQTLYGTPPATPIINVGAQKFGEYYWVRPGGVVTVYIENYDSGTTYEWYTQGLTINLHLDNTRVWDISIPNEYTNYSYSIRYIGCVAYKNGQSAGTGYKYLYISTIPPVSY